MTSNRTKKRKRASYELTNDKFKWDIWVFSWFRIERSNFWEFFFFEIFAVFANLTKHMSFFRFAPPPKKKFLREWGWVGSWPKVCWGGGRIFPRCESVIRNHMESPMYTHANPGSALEIWIYEAMTINQMALKYRTAQITQVVPLSLPRPLSIMSVYFKTVCKRAIIGVGELFAQHKSIYIVRIAQLSSFIHSGLGLPLWLIKQPGMRLKRQSRMTERRVPKFIAMVVRGSQTSQNWLQILGERGNFYLCTPTWKW